MNPLAACSTLFGVTHTPRFSGRYTAWLNEQLVNVPAVFCGSQTALQSIAKALRVL